MGLVEGKVIIVTGASSGIGEKTAEVLAAEGAGVIESRSSGMKGTYIKVINDVVFDELKKLEDK